jgi:hypothetical protein
VKMEDFTASGCAGAPSEAIYYPSGQCIGSTANGIKYTCS